MRNQTPCLGIFQQEVSHLSAKSGVFRPTHVANQQNTWPTKQNQIFGAHGGQNTIAVLFSDYCKPVASRMSFAILGPTP